MVYLIGHVTIMPITHQSSITYIIYHVYVISLYLCFIWLIIYPYIYTFVYLHVEGFHVAPGSFGTDTYQGPV